MSVPFLHLAFIAVLALAWALVQRLRAAVTRPWLAPLVATTVAAAAAALGLVPWLGEYQLTAFGFFLLMAFVVAWQIAAARRGALSERRLIDVVLIALVAGVAGARARFVWENWHAIAHDDAGMARPWLETLTIAADFDGGGMVWYGGLFLAGLAVSAYIHRHRLGFWAMADLVAPAVLAGLAVGRLGCWFNGCCYGAVTALPWGVRRDGHDHAIHPTQLYEAGAVAALVIALLLVERWLKRPGVLAALSCIGYGAWRFINEGLRGDHHPGARTAFFGMADLSTSQATSIYLAVGGVVLLAVAMARDRGPATPGTLTSTDPF
ncbi:MAG: prolipoprotein diacylglyceryl transferase [Planctomycetes bacterium]|nr:prolipoprotein diacylglyceryl transferase [Planctomycetota bacterium]